MRATESNEAMKLAAVHALAELARPPVPPAVHAAYGNDALTFGRLHLIPIPLDPRLLTTVAPAVTRAAMASGMARRAITDWPAYEAELQGRLVE